MGAHRHLNTFFAICIVTLLCLAIVLVSAAEDLTVSFMSASGATTANTYSGQVQVSVSGTGQSSGIAFNDAFYVFTSYTDGTNVTPYVQVPFHMYINGQSVTNWTSAPAYSADHCYTVTIDAGSTAQKLTFKIGDGYVADNSGSFTVRVGGTSLCQVQEPPQEEPCTNDCSPSGTKTCSDTTGYKTCGNYDADSCLDWSKATNCTSGQSCSNGACIIAEDPLCNCSTKSTCMGTTCTCITQVGHPYYRWCYTEPKVACTDTDNTHADFTADSTIYVKGTTTGTSRCQVAAEKVVVDCSPTPTTSTDQCRNLTHLWEYYCAVDERLTINTFSCSNGCVDGACLTAPPCTNDCSPSGTKTCSGIGYKTCGNYDTDTCLEWSNVTSCSPGTTCVNGVCVQQAVAKADLTVTDIVFTPANPTEGQSVSIVSKVKNIGNKASGVVNIKGYIDDELVAYGSFGPLQPGAIVPDYSNNVGWGDPWVPPRGKAVAGTHTFRFVIDADNYEAESNETNNAFEKTLTVAANATTSVRKPDYISTSISGPQWSSSTNPNQPSVGVTFGYNTGEKANFKLYKKVGNAGSWELKYATSLATTGVSSSDYDANSIGTTYYYYATAIVGGQESQPTEVKEFTLYWPNCSDTDYDTEHRLGVNWYVKGTHKGSTDYCKDSTMLYEYFCMASGNADGTGSTGYSCPSGCNDGACNGGITCTNDCSSSGTKTCSGLGYKTCGNYDADTCLEWSTVTNCSSGTTCLNGACVTQSEADLTVSFTSTSGATTVNTYSGQIQVSVTGTGQSSGIAYNDAFYVFTSYTDGSSVTPYVQLPFHLYVNGQSISTWTTAPAYNAGHCYTFTINAGTTPQKLTFKIGDTYVVDNTGAFVVRIGGAPFECNASCTDDCSSSGTKTCSGLGYKTCGYYDADSCLDWSNVTNCGSGETCAGGTCTAAVFCGNGLCDTGENCAACPGDCACGAGRLCCNQACSVPACAANSDCNDGNALTTDTCSYGGTCSASCTNQPCTIRCSSDSQCNDASSTTTDTCSNPGTCSASCTYEMCTIVCTTNANCDDANPNTADTCSNPGTCSASCVHAQNPSYDNNGVCDVSVGENCLNAPGDCACIAGQLCKPSRTSNVNGCARIECGDGYLDPREENCCADAGCGLGLFCDVTANACVACRTDNDCGVGYCSNTKCVECRSNTDCESGLCEAGTCVECLVDEHCSARRIWDPSPECTNDQHSVFQRGKIIEGKCNKNSHKCVGQEKVIQRNVRDCSPDYCQDGKCGCADGFFACEAVGGCVAKNGLENGKACGCDEQCAGGFCQEGLCRAPSLNLSAKNPNLKMGVENEVFFSIKNPFDEEIEFTIMLSVGAGVDVSKVLACDDAIGSLCKVTRRLLPGASTSLSLGVLPQSLEQSVSVQGTVAYTYRDKTLEMSQEMSLGSEGGVEIVELPVKKTGVKRILQSTLFTVVVATLLATTGIGYVYRNRLTIGAKIEDLLDSLRSDREERRELRPSMPNREEVEAEEQLRNYIIKARAKGHSDEVIRNALLKKGWDSQQVKNGLERK